MTSHHPMYFGTDPDVWKRASSSGKFGTLPAGSRDKAPAENPVGGKQKLHVKKTCATPFFRKSHLENRCEIEAVSVGSFAARCFCRGVGLVRDGMDNLFATELDLTGTLASSQPFRSSSLPACTWPSISISGFLSSPVEN